MTLDLSDPRDLTILGKYCAPYAPERLTVANNIAYVAFGSGGLRGVSVTDPLNPVLAFSYDSPGYAFAPTVEGDIVCLADSHGGLVVLEIEGVERSSNPGPYTDAGWSAAGPLASDWPHGALSTTSVRPGPLRRDRPMLPALDQGRSAKQSGVQRAGPANREAGNCPVTSTADSGPGTLRECIQDAVSGDTITFDPAVFPPSSPATIMLSSGLPAIDQGDITLDASDAGVILDGSHQNGSLALVSDGNVVKGLQIVSFPWAGVSICCGARYNVIGGNRCRGASPTGEGNVISDNGIAGVHISDTGTRYNVVVGNFIGTDPSGTSSWGNGYIGVGIENGASFNRIGGPEQWERNVISGNASDGVAIDSYIGDTMGNSVIGNFIGTDVSGTSAVPNKWTGVAIMLGAFCNLVEDNLISGNDWLDVIVLDPGTAYNTVVGNLIGTDATGSQPLSDRPGSVYMGAFGSFNRIGGTSPEDANVVTGGIGLWGTDTVVVGNFIGTDVSGTSAITHGQGPVTGVAVSHAANCSFVGGASAPERNLISGLTGAGISISGSDLTFVLGNDIGTNATGSVALANRWSGIEVSGGKHNVIQNNVIAANADGGVWLRHDSSFNQVRANLIGVARDRVSPLPNGIAGVNIEEASSNLIGGLYPEDSNIIAFNDGTGVDVWAGSRNTIRRNSIHSNVGPGIQLGGGGNDELPAPSIFSVFPGSVYGTACPQCIVELFSDDEDEGRLYEGMTVADGSGIWTWSGSLSGPFITATATDAEGNTSPFSAPHALVDDTPTPTATATASPSPTQTATATATDTATSTSTPTATATSTPSPTASSTPTPTSTPTRTPTATATSSPTSTSTRTATPTASPTATPTKTVTKTPSSTRTPTRTTTPTPTASRKATPTATQTRTPTRSATPTSTSTATACADSYEPDDQWFLARSIVVGAPAQTHNAHVAGDLDFVKFAASAAESYVIRTFDLGGRPDNDTVLTLYDVDGTSLLAYNDEHPQEEPGASRIEWQATHAGTCFVQIAQFSPNAGGCDLIYSLEVTLGTPVPTATHTCTPTGVPGSRRLYLPLVLRESGP